MDEMFVTLWRRRQVRLEVAVDEVARSCSAFRMTVLVRLRGFARLASVAVDRLLRRARVDCFLAELRPLLD